MAIDLTGRVDRWAGQGIEKANRRHHRRRLQRIGQIDRLDPPRDGELWAAGDPPPRDGCELEVLIVIRTRLLLSRSLREDDPAAAVEVLEEAVSGAERMEVPHLAGAARTELLGA